MFSAYRDRNWVIPGRQYEFFQATDQNDPSKLAIFPVLLEQCDTLRPDRPGKAFQRPV